MFIFCLDQLNHLLIGHPALTLDPPNISHIYSQNSLRRMLILLRTLRWFPTAHRINSQGSSPWGTGSLCQPLVLLTTLQSLCPLCSANHAPVLCPHFLPFLSTWCFTAQHSPLSLVPPRKKSYSLFGSQWRSPFLERISPRSPKLGYYRVWKHTALLLLLHLYLWWVVWLFSQLSVSLPRCFTHRRCLIDICGRNIYLALIFLSLCSSEEGVWDKHILLLLLGSDPKSKTKG